VLLAFAVKEWRETKNQDELARKALTSIRQEVERNRSVVAEPLPYHRAMRDSMASYLPELRGVSVDEIDLRRLGFARGAQFNSVYSPAWKTARASGVPAVWLSQTLMSDMTSQERRLLHLYVRNAPATSPRQTRPRGRSDEQPPRRESLAKREQRLHFSLFPRIVELQ
jgi:hypothetical protein